MNSDEMLVKILNKVNDMDNKIITLDNKVDGMGNKINTLENKVNDMDNKIITLDNKVDGMGNKINTLENKVDDMDNKINTLDNKVDKMEIQLNENTKILRALEHNSQVHKAEMDNFNHQIAKVNGNLTNFNSDTNVKLDRLKEDIEFLTSKETKNEKEIFKLKKRIN